MADLSREHDNLYERVAQIVEAARAQVARTVNTAMVHAYWLIGRCAPSRAGSAGSSGEVSATHR